MSSTDDHALRLFYLNHLVPTASKLRDRGTEFFPLRATEELSWYEPPPTAQDLVEFDPAEFGSELSAIWQKEGNFDLIPLAGPLFELAQKLELEVEERDDVSPFMYVMF